MRSLPLTNFETKFNFSPINYLNNRAFHFPHGNSYLPDKSSAYSSVEITIFTLVSKNSKVQITKTLLIMLRNIGGHF